MVRVFCSIRDGRMLLAVTGHANSVKDGADPVCAACSILVDTLAAMLCRGREEGAFYVAPTIHQGRGEAILSCAPRADRYEEFLHDFYMTHIGFALLSRAYPACVEVEYVEDKKGR